MFSTLRAMQRAALTWCAIRVAELLIKADEEERARASKEASGVASRAPSSTVADLYAPAGRNYQEACAQAVAKRPPTKWVRERGWYLVGRDREVGRILYWDDDRWYPPGTMVFPGYGAFGAQWKIFLEGPK